MMEAYDAILFDCDGVLVNSELIAQRIELELLESIGMIYPRDEYVRRFSGTSEPAYRAALREDAISRFAVELGEDFFDRMDDALASAYEDRLEAISGAGALATAWPKAKAVASSSSLRSVLGKLRATGLGEIFGEHIYSADVVGAGKPDPALFLYAADRLRVRPSRCLVIEDSVNGVVAAKRAGMTAVGFIGGGHCLDDQAEHLLANGADVVVDAHADLAARLGLRF
jgi:HAD superfamily hydrolase (TIGR01509 family)